MAEDDDEPDDGDEETYYEYLQEQREAFSHQLPDVLLRTYVVICNRHRLQFGVTLHVGGLVVSGMLTPASEWMGNLAGYIDANSVGDDPSVLTSPMREMGISIELQTMGGEPTDEEIDQEHRSTRYIHLRDATVFQGSREIGRGIFWRGRLASIDGWFIGHARPAD